MKNNTQWIFMMKAIFLFFIPTKKENIPQCLYQLACQCLLELHFFFYKSFKGINIDMCVSYDLCIYNRGMQQL